MGSRPNSRALGRFQLDMGLMTIFRQAFRSLGRRWIQSLLSVLGIAVGVAAFICVVAIGNAGTSAVESQLQNLGDNFIWVEAGSRTGTVCAWGRRGTRSLVREMRMRFWNKCL